MNERDYIKVNTSIQTGSNAKDLLRNANGDIEATIELLLPDSLFSSDAAHAITDVDMQTSKIRLSLERTPIAALPYDQKEDDEFYRSTCALDVYPFNFIEETMLYPPHGRLSSNTYPFMPYTQYFLNGYYLGGDDMSWDDYSPSNLPSASLEIACIYDTHCPNSYTYNIQQQELLDLVRKLEEMNALDGYVIFHPDMNLYIKKKNSSVHQGKIFISDIGDLTSGLESALESALRRAFRYQSGTFNFYFLCRDRDGKFPTWSGIIEIPGEDRYVYLPKDAPELASDAPSSEITALKPTIEFGDDSFSISYDTATTAEGGTPVIWNGRYIDDGVVPPQLRNDISFETSLTNCYYLPPLKRFYYQELEVDSDNQTYQNTVSETNAHGYYICGNKETKETFSLLPWKKIDWTTLIWPTEENVPSGTYLYHKYKNIVDRAQQYLNDEVVFEQHMVTDQAGAHTLYYKELLVPFQYEQNTFYWVYRFHIEVTDEEVVYPEDDLRRYPKQYRYFQQVSYAYTVDTAWEAIGDHLVNDFSYTGTDCKYYESKFGQPPETPEWTPIQPAYQTSVSYSTRPKYPSTPQTTYGESESVETTIIPGEDPTTTVDAEQLRWLWGNEQAYHIGSKAMFYDGLVTDAQGNILYDRGYAFPDYDLNRDGENSWVDGETYLPWGAIPKRTPDLIRAHIFASTTDIVEVFWKVVCPFPDPAYHQPGQIWKFYGMYFPNPQYYNPEFDDPTIVSASTIRYPASHTYRTVETKHSELNVTNTVPAPKPLFDLEEGKYFYILATDSMIVNTSSLDPVTCVHPEHGQIFRNNRNLEFIWPNIPTVTLSPIASIVLTLSGLQMKQEIQPVNITDVTGSSLVTTIPVIENFYSLAQTLRDLHDEMVVAKDNFETTATYNVSITSGRERSIRISAKYLTKDGNMYQIYIPNNGVFALQLIFGTSIYEV